MQQKISYIPAKESKIVAPDSHFNVKETVSNGAEKSTIRQSHKQECMDSICTYTCMASTSTVVRAAECSSSIGNAHVRLPCHSSKHLCYRRAGYGLLRGSFCVCVLVQVDESKYSVAMASALSIGFHCKGRPGVILGSRTANLHWKGDQTIFESGGLKLHLLSRLVTHSIYSTA